ncbi:transposase [Pseudomonas sp. CM25]|uniref:REP-associated tyrosine transposase n=1 Tax=Pseudomonas sp. CM25 TaxID=2738448 RepID=UPI0021159D61|nr:transposase [Pseudomonas sp. CM25]
MVIHQLRQSDEEHSCRSLAWVLMPDHLHWLIELKGTTLGTLMRRFKSRSSLVLHRAGVEHDPVWQPGYQDRALRREENMVDFARYIVANPLRAGLVSSVRDYPHWDAVWL